MKNKELNRIAVTANEIEIFSDLIDNAEDYDLGGVEFTSEDVDYVKSLMEAGASYDDAIHECLTNIRDVLN